MYLSSYAEAGAETGDLVAPTMLFVGYYIGGKVSEAIGDVVKEGNGRCTWH